MSGGGQCDAAAGGREVTEAKQVPWVSPDVVDDLNEAVACRWRDLDPMLPAPRDLPDGCRLVATGANGRPAGVGLCRHRQVPGDALEQVWGTATRLDLTPRLREPDTFAALDELLGQWRDHLAALPEASGEDSAAMINWPSRDISGVRALLKHGMQPLTVIAVRPAGRTILAGDSDLPPGVVIRPARPDDLDAVAELEMGVIRFDAHFGAAILRPATEALVRVDTLKALTQRPDWAWVAERDSRLVGLVHVQPPEESAWIAFMTRPGTTAYLQTMFVGPDVRGGGLGAALVKHAHAQVDARGISTILLHYAQLNPLSVPFWHRMGYRPLWTGWETRPASALR
jgi:GNAT superfamily N-acetyltransferase